MFEVLLISLPADDTCCTGFWSARKLAWIMTVMQVHLRVGYSIVINDKLVYKIKENKLLTAEPFSYICQLWRIIPKKIRRSLFPHNFFQKCRMVICYWTSSLTVGLSALFWWIGATDQLPWMEETSSKTNTYVTDSEPSKFSFAVAFILHGSSSMQREVLELLGAGMAVAAVWELLLAVNFLLWLTWEQSWLTSASSVLP